MAATYEGQWNAILTSESTSDEETGEHGLQLTKGERSDTTVLRKGKDQS